MTIKLFLAVAAFAAAAPVAAQEVSPPTPAPATALQVPTVAIKIVPAAAAAPVQKSEIICKSTLETGSLVKKHRACFTRKQWVYINNESEGAARKMMDDNMGKGAPSN